MRLSVALCTYNGCAFLDQQLGSFLHQTRLPDELVVCDDASTDATFSRLEAFAAAAPFPVRLVRNPVNLGYSRNFMQAALLCSGDIIAFSDQDDIWYPGKLARLQQIFTVDPDIQGVFSDGDILDDDSQPVGRTLWKSFLFGPADQARLASGKSLDVLLRRNVVTGMSFAFRRAHTSLLVQCPDSWMHDGWLAIALALHGGLHACPDRLVGYRVHGRQQVGTPATLAMKGRSLLRHGTKAYRQNVLDRNLDEYQRTALQFDDLLEILKQTPEVSPQILRKVASKAQHAHRGADALARPRLSRFARLLPHAHDYLSFSPNGMRGLLRDLFV